jgi:hypothetical protein
VLRHAEMPVFVMRQTKSALPRATGKDL